jgi:hypothetical protein
MTSFDEQRRYPGDHAAWRAEVLPVGGHLSSMLGPSSSTGSRSREGMRWR